MARPKSSTKMISVSLTEDMLLQHYSPAELLQIATRALTGGKGASGVSASVSGAGSESAGPTKAKKKRKPFSPEVRAKMAAAQKARWAKKPRNKK